MRMTGIPGLAGLLLAVCLAPIVSVAQEDKPAEVSVEMPLIRVSEHVWYVQGKPVVATGNEGFVFNAGVVVTGDGVVVFDALGTPALARKLVRRIRELTDQPIRKVVVSHYHADHIYGLQVFKDLGAEIIAPAGAEAYLDSEAARNRLEERRVSLYPWVDEQTRLVPPDRFVEDRMELRLGEVTLALQNLGDAHSDADLTMFVRPDRVLFSGDIIFEGRIPFVGSANTRHWLQTLEQLDTEGVRALIPGHGPAASDPGQAIRLTRDYLAFLRREMGRAVEEMIPFDEAYAEVDWNRWRSLPTFDEANRRNAYQVYLSLEAEGFGED